jgi:hypothetical protein
MGKDILATDPRGFRVEFWEARWQYLIKKHPDLIIHHITPEHLGQAIKRPKDGCIYSSHRYPANCAIYYIRYSEKLDLVVVVKYIDDVGEIVTTHLCGNRPDGERLIWPKLNE